MLYYQPLLCFVEYSDVNDQIQENAVELFKDLFVIFSKKNYFRNKNVSFGGDKVFIYFFILTSAISFRTNLYLDFLQVTFFLCQKNYYQKYMQDKQKFVLLHILIWIF